MSYNGSGTFQINTSGQPVVAGTVISSTAFNALTADLATGLSTAITKDGQTTTTARIPFAAGINSSSATDSTSTATGSIITAGGVGVAKALYVGTTANVAGAVTLQSTLGVTGVATFSAAPIYSSLTASSAVATDASKALVSVTNTGTGNNVLATSPTITTPTISQLSSAAATALTLQSAGTTAITVDTSQNVGIGTASPSGISTYPTLDIRGSAGGGLRYGNATVHGYLYADSNGGQIGTATNSPFVLYSNGTERMRIPAAGGIQSVSSISVGNTAPTASGAGITFPATQSASTNANTLDDYEEGTWTPVINPATGTVTSSVVAGTYVKVGRQVTLNYDALITGGTITSVSSIGGFPFTTGSAAVAASGACREYNAVGQLWNLTAGPNATNAGLVNYANSTTVTNSFGWNGTLVYQV